MTDSLNGDERRSAYRVHPASPDELDLSVLGRSQQRIHGEIANIAVGGARVRFENNNAPKLAAGDHIVLAFASTQHQYDGNVLAKVISLSEGAENKVVQLAFDDEYEPLNLKRDELFALFNRRSKLRGVAGTANENFRTTISLTNGGDAQLQDHPVSIINISNTGVSFAVDAETDTILKAHSELRLMLERLEDGSVNKVACIVRHHSKSGGAYNYGCEYDWSATVDPLAVVEDFVTYLLERPDKN